MLAKKRVRDGFGNRRLLVEALNIVLMVSGIICLLVSIVLWKCTVMPGRIMGHMSDVIRDSERYSSDEHKELVKALMEINKNLGLLNERILRVNKNAS